MENDNKQIKCDEFYYEKNKDTNKWEVFGYDSMDESDDVLLIATFDLEGNVEWIEKEYQEDELAKDAVKSYLDNFVFSNVGYNTLKDELEKAFTLQTSSGTTFIKVHNPDGYTYYGFHREYILEAEIWLVGMVGINENIRKFNIEEKPQAIDWLINDITEAVGDTFALEIEY